MDEEKIRTRIEDYAHSPTHYLVATNDLPRLNLLLSSLPKPVNPLQIESESDSHLATRIADAIAAVIDRRDVPNGDSPLHLAAALDHPAAAAALLTAGADPSLQNSGGWTPFQLALCHRRRRLALLLLRHHRLSAFAKFRRRLPLLLAALSKLPDFYFELDFHFESSVIPFLSRAAPSDTYRFWKRGADLRADTTLAGFDGLRVRRADQSFLFLGSSKSLLVLNRSKKEVRDAFEGMDSAADSDLIEDASAHRPGIDITAAELVKTTNWRRKERIEMVGDWKSRVYEMHNVLFTFKTMKAAAAAPPLRPEEILELELDEESEEGYIVAEIPRVPSMPPRHSCYERGRFGNGGREEVVLELGRRRSLDVPPEEDKRWEKVGVGVARGRGGGGGGVKSKEKETVKSLKPMLWLTEDFPLKTEELMPLLDILANKVKAVRRLRELLATKLPQGTFPVKVAIPIVPTVRVIVTFTKFTELQPSEEFFTPLSSPRHLPVPEEEEHRRAESGSHKSSWLKWSSSATKHSVARSKSISPSQVVNHVDPFSIPRDYTWISMNKKSQRVKKYKSTKGKQKEPV